MDSLQVLDAINVISTSAYMSALYYEKEIVDYYKKEIEKAKRMILDWAEEVEKKERE